MSQFHYSQVQTIATMLFSMTNRPQNLLVFSDENFGHQVLEVGVGKLFKDNVQLFSNDSVYLNNLKRQQKTLKI